MNKPKPAMTLAFVSPRFPEGTTIGGAETVLKNLAIRAAAAGCQVDFLTTCASDHFTWANALPAGKRMIDGVNVHFFPADQDRDIETFIRVQKRISTGAEVSDEEEQQWLSNNVNSSLLCDHLRQHGAEYDRIVAGPYLFGLTYAASAIHQDRTLLLPCLHDEPFAYLRAFQAMFRRAKCLMFNSEPEQELARRLYGLDSSQCAVVGTGLDAFDPDPESFRARHRIAAPYVLYCGRREPLKGTPLLLDYMSAFRQRTGRDVKLVLTGSGPVNVPVELEPHLLDAGLLPETEKQNAMAGATVFCHPSVNESLSIVILESWLAGTPVLVNGGADVMPSQCKKSGGGLWFRNYPEFEEQLILLLDNPELCSAMADAGRRYVVKEYSWQRIREKLFDALKRP